MQEESAIEGQRVCGRRHSPTLISVFDVFDVSRLKLGTAARGRRGQGRGRGGEVGGGMAVLHSD